MPSVGYSQERAEAVGKALTRVEAKPKLTQTEVLGLLKNLEKELPPKVSEALPVGGLKKPSKNIGGRAGRRGRVVATGNCYQTGSSADTKERATSGGGATGSDVKSLASATSNDTPTSPDAKERVTTDRGESGSDVKRVKYLTPTTNVGVDPTTSIASNDSPTSPETKEMGTSGGRATGSDPTTGNHVTDSEGGKEESDCGVLVSMSLNIFPVSLMLPQNKPIFYPACYFKLVA